MSVDQPIREAPPLLSASEIAAFKRSRRGRNYALLTVLIGLCVLFYAITIAKMGLK